MTSSAGLDWALRPESRVVLLMTHPAFRQPRHSGWGYDEGRKLTYRRVDGYLSEMAVPMKSLGGGLPTRSFHRPISAYVNALAAAGFATDAMVEIPDLPPDRRPGKAARRRRSRPRRDPDLPGTARRPSVTEQARRGVSGENAPPPSHPSTGSPS